jgi:hypothetical protein
MMKKSLSNYGGIVLLYLIVILGIFLMNVRFGELNKSVTNNNNYYYAYNN